MQGLITLELIQLSRKCMADFLFSLKGEGAGSPRAVLHEAWATALRNELKGGESIEAFIGTKMPPIFEKILRANLPKVGFSINQIVKMGNQIEFTNLSSTAVQNWVKRDVKQLIGSPQLGKKYTVEQAATLFIVEDLKASLDFDSIRQILALLFNNPEDRTDDVIDPLQFYRAYAAIFEKAYNQDVAGQSNHSQIDQYIQKEALILLDSFQDLTAEQNKIVSNVLVTATLSVLSAYYKTMTRKYVTAAMSSNR